MIINKNIFAEITRKSSRTFYLTSSFFPKDIRDKVYVLYAFVRTVDDYVDNRPPQIVSYETFKKLTQNAFNGEKTQEVLIDSFYQLAISEKFEKNWVWDFFRSQDLDLKTKQYLSFKDTEKFIYGVAEVIGLMMAKIMGLPESSYQSARQLGKAMQILNIIRDIKEDYESGKVYVPQEEIKNFGLTDIIPKNDSQKDNFNRLIRYQLDRFNRIIREAEDCFDIIPKKYLLPIKTSSDLYKRVAKKIYVRPMMVLESKIKPGFVEIFYHLAKNYLNR